MLFDVWNIFLPWILYLSSKKMVPWLRIILRSPSVVEEFYEPWAYVVQPGKPNYSIIITLSEK